MGLFGLKNGIYSHKHSEQIVHSSQLASTHVHFKSQGAGSKYTSDFLDKSFWNRHLLLRYSKLIISRFYFLYKPSYECRNWDFCFLLSLSGFKPQNSLLLECPPTTNIDSNGANVFSPNSAAKTLSWMYRLHDTEKKIPMEDHDAQWHKCIPRFPLFHQICLQILQESLNKYTLNWFFHQ